MFIEFSWYCKNQRVDPDNIAFGKKFVLDGFIKAGILSNDGWNDIKGFEDKFFIDKENPRVEIKIRSVL